MKKNLAVKKRLISWLVRDKYNGVNSADLTKDLARLKRGEPVDYVIGWSDFCGCRIGLETRPLIPRPETEYWTKRVTEEIGDKKVKCLDIFAGSGCVGIAVLKHCPRATVDFAEKSAKFCRQIKKNCDLNGIAPTRYRIIQSDVFKTLRSSSPKSGNLLRRRTPKCRYDFILANPPYVPVGRKLGKSVIDWEPAGALYAGDDGLDLIKKFFRQAKKYLNENGKVYLEFDSGQKPVLVKLLKETGYKNIEFHQDQFGRFRFLTFS